jgi:hypothetical protein
MKLVNLKNKTNNMTKDTFILVDGQIKTPFPLYPREMRNEKASLGGMKNTEISTKHIELANPDQGKGLFNIIAEKIRETQTGS